VEGVPGGQHVNQRAEAYATRVLGQDCVQEHDIGHDLEAVLVEMMLRRPHRVIPEGVAVLGVCQEVGVDPPIVSLAVLPLMRGGAVDARVRHVHRPVEEDTEMHRSLQGPGHGARRRPCLPGLADTRGAVERDRPYPCDYATARPRMQGLFAWKRVASISAISAFADAA
jgi:hypothetical protein